MGVEHLFQAKCLRTELYMVIQPFSHFSYFIFDRRQLSVIFFYNIRKPTQQQPIRPYPYTPESGNTILCCSTPTIASCMPQSSLDNVSIFDEFAQRALVIKSARAIFQRI